MSVVLESGFVVNRCVAFDESQQLVTIEVAGLGIGHVRYSELTEKDLTALRSFAATTNPKEEPLTMEPVLTETPEKKKRVIPKDPVAHAITMISRAALKRNAKANAALAFYNAKIEELDRALDVFREVTVGALDPDAADLVKKYFEKKAEKDTQSK